MKKTLYTKLAIGVLSLQLAGSALAQEKKMAPMEDRAIEIVFCGEYPEKCFEDGLPMLPNGEWAINPYEVYGPDGVKSRAEIISNVAADLRELDNGVDCDTDAPAPESPRSRPVTIPRFRSG